MAASVGPTAGGSRFAKRLFLLQFGAEPVPKSMSVLGADETIHYEPVYGIAVETDEGWVVLETGFSRAALEDEKAQEAIYGTAVAQGFRPWGLEGEPYETALVAIGLAVSDVSLAALSHFHIDHTGGLPLLAEAGVPVAVQECELDFSIDRGGLEEACYRPDYVDRGIDWRLLDGDAELAPGVYAISTPGHTPGHMSYRVDLPETGTWIFVTDAADLAQNLFDPVPIGWAARPEDAGLVLPSIRRLLDEAERLDARLIPCHDPIVWKAIGNPRGGHR